MKLICITLILYKAFSYPLIKHISIILTQSYRCNFHTFLETKQVILHLPSTGINEIIKKCYLVTYDYNEISQIFQLQPIVKSNSYLNSYLSVVLVNCSKLFCRWCYYKTLSRYNKKGNHKNILM